MSKLINSEQIPQQNKKLSILNKIATKYMEFDHELSQVIRDSNEWYDAVNNVFQHVKNKKTKIHDSTEWSDFMSKYTM